MYRRTWLRAAGAALPLALVGCSEDGGSDGEGDDPEGVAVEALDATPDDPATTLTAAFDTRTQFSLKPDEAGLMQPDQGQTQHLVVQLRVTNDGEASTRVRPSVFQVADPEEGGGVYRRYETDDPDQFPDRRLDPGDVANGWIVFEIPAAKARVLLAARESKFPDAVAVTFEEADLDFTVTDDETGTTVPGRSSATAGSGET